MRSGVGGDPERLELFADVTTRKVADARPPISRLSRAIYRFGAARNDLGTVVVDPTAAIGAELDLLNELDLSARAFAFALRNADRFAEADHLYGRLRIGSEERVQSLVQAYLQNPGMAPEELLDVAMDGVDRGWRLPWADGVGAWLRGEASSVPFWINTPIAAALDTVVLIDRNLVVSVSGYTRANGTEVAPHPRWRPGYADRMNRVATAAQVRTWTRVATWGSRILPFLGAAAARLYLDHGDDSLSVGDRIARTGAAAIVEGGAAFGGQYLGATAGAALGSAIVPPVGTIVGGVAGGLVGGFIGGQVGANILDNHAGAIESVGRGIDNALDGIVSFGTSVSDSASEAFSELGRIGGRSTAVDGGAW